MKRNIYFLIITLLLTVSGVSAIEVINEAELKIAVSGAGVDNEVILTDNITINDCTVGYGLLIGRTLTLRPERSNAHNQYEYSRLQWHKNRKRLYVDH